MAWPLWAGREGWQFSMPGIFNCLMEYTFNLYRLSDISFLISGCPHRALEDGVLQILKSRFLPLGFILFGTRVLFSSSYRCGHEYPSLCHFSAILIPKPVLCHWFNGFWQETWFCSSEAVTGKPPNKGSAHACKWGLQNTGVNEDIPILFPGFADIVY